MLKNCAMSQFVGVKVSDGGETVTAPGSLFVIMTVRLIEGSKLRVTPTTVAWLASSPISTLSGSVSMPCTSRGSGPTSMPCASTTPGRTEAEQPSSSAASAERTRRRRPQECARDDADRAALRETGAERARERGEFPQRGMSAPS